MASSAFKMIKMVWDHNHEAAGFSWTRLNHSMHEAVMLAIHAGMRFERGDFAKIFHDFRGGYWFDSEHFYSEAVKYRHMTACHSFETFKDRKPFIFGNERVYIGRDMFWAGQKGKVTSILATHFIITVPRGWVDATADEIKYLYGCQNGKKWDSTPKKRIKVTHKDCQKTSPRHPKKKLSAAA